MRRSLTLSWGLLLLAALSFGASAGCLFAPQASQAALGLFFGILAWALVDLSNLVAGLPV